MSGFEAITHYNGWAMATVGATIVISGLAFLSLIISQLHKIIALMENKPVPVVAIAEEEPVTKKSLAELCPTNIDATLELYRPLVEELEEQFQLVELYELAEKYHLEHPHLSIRCLRNGGKLVAQGDGFFTLAA
ncbi:MAG: hypothetical protein CSA26_01915 [Desulfobacterales bacterium]|nr:MAG: hypothetical protein CSA26_01915 [Desulfobacterales bacterium]